MGVPKFYRWISERYPCLSEIVKENQIPEFDNLYLDMNGIIHTCSHPNDEDVHFRMPEEKMFKDIFHYIEVLFRIIRPRKVFFMAVDGVAPRAKMNQQRGRRFRSAKEAIQREKEAVAKGEKLPTEKRFDSNCITPGTEFMVRLQKQLAYFVNQKITNDRLWHGIRVYLSGHETPGEGEHKIMDFIRSEKCRDGYDPNTRHCLYGLDADLLMLGLVSHEPHFSLLREEVRFGRQAQAQRPTTPEETTFHLLHLSLLREYLAEEFVELKSLPWYDVENIIDDWVMMGFLVGNDFIPNLPNMHINHGALPQLYQIYIKLLPSLNGYINNGGTLHLRRFETFLRALSQHDEEVFKQSMEEFDYLTSKSSKEAWKSQRVQKKIEERETRRKLAEENKLLQHAIDFGGKKPHLDLDDDNESVDSLTEELKKSGLQIMEFSEGSDEDCDTSALEHKMKKRQYYRDKLEKDFVSDEEVQRLAIEYVRAIQWILHYYYNGCQSWSWFYPYHYAPYVSDISGFSNMKFEYEFSRPFLPFQQLLAVLPSASKELLPDAYQGLMTHQDSPIIDYYPEDFEEDLNGKQQSWEAVVKIPFIDEKRLLSAMAEKDPYLKDPERKRNTHSEHLLYTFSPDVNFRLPSSLPGHFPDIPCCHAKLQKIALNKFWLPKENVKKGLCEGVKLGVYYPGFPTLYHLKFESELRKEDVKVFQQNSRGDNMILKITDTTTVKNADSLHHSLLGKAIYAEWPHMKEVRVVAVADDMRRYELVEGARSSNQKGSSVRCIDLSGNEVEKFYNVDIATITSHYHKRKGVLIGDTSVLVYACPLLGRKYICSNGGAISLEKQWAPDPQVFAYQMIVRDIAVHDTSFKKFKTLGEVFPQNTECFMLGNPHYGAMGKVIETKEDKVTVQFVVPPDPDFHHIMRREQQYQMQYFSAHSIGKKLAVSSHLVSRLTGTIFISKGPPPSTGAEPDGKHGSRVNIGLNLKFNKSGEEVPGYTKKEAEGAPWTYSHKLLDVLRQYVTQFPEVFEMLSGNRSQSDIFYETDVFENSPGRLKELKDWLEDLECRKATKAKIGQQALDEPIIKMMEEEVSKTSLGRSKKVKMSVRPHLLHRPFDYQGNLVPDPQATYTLYDRVINVREGYSVPLGLKGVVVGIQDGATILDKIYEVVFDEEFVGGLKLRCSGYRGYRVTASALINISYGHRKTQRNEKPLAVVKPQQNEIRFFEPTSSARHTQQEQWYANKISSLGSSPKRGERTRERGAPQRIQDMAPQEVRQRERRGPGQQHTTQPPEEPPSIPTPPSFAAMVKPGGVQTSTQKTQSAGPEEAKTGHPKYTILRKDEKAGKQGGVLRKRERLVKRSSSGNMIRADGPSEESSTSSEAPITSPEHSVSPLDRVRVERAKERDPKPVARPVGEPESADKLAELWEKLKVGEGSQGGMPPNMETQVRSNTRGEEAVVVGGRISTASDPWRNDDPLSVGDASNSASIQGEGDSSELLSPEEIWDEESECDSLQEEERITPDTIAKNETKEKLCQLLNLSHITGGISPQGGELSSPTPAQGEETLRLTLGKKITIEELLEGSLSAALKPSFKDATPNPPPGFAPLSDADTERMPLPPNTHQLFPSPGVQPNLFPSPGVQPNLFPRSSAQQPMASLAGKSLGPAQVGPILSQSGMGGVQPTEGQSVPPMQRSTIPEKSAFQPVPQNLQQTMRLPPGFMPPPKQYQQGPRAGPMVAPVSMGVAPQQNPFFPPGVRMPGIVPGASAGAAQFHQFQGQKMPIPPSFPNMGRFSAPPPLGRGHPPNMSHPPPPPPGLTNRAQPIGPPRMFFQEQQMKAHSRSNVAGYPGLSFPNTIQEQDGPNKSSPSGTGPAVNTSSLGQGQPTPQPIGHQLTQPGASNPLTMNPGAPDRMRSPPGQPGYPPIQPLLEAIMNMGGTSGPTGSIPSGQPMDTMLNKLRAYCESKGLRHPNYEYIDTDIMGEYFVIIYLPTGQIVQGERCKGRRNALEVAAFKALKLMRSCPEVPEYPGPPPTQFVPLQVTKKLTPRKTPNTEDLLGLNLDLPAPGLPQGNPLLGEPIPGEPIPSQSLFDGQSFLSSALGIGQPSTAVQPPLQPTIPAENLVPQDAITEEQLLGNLLLESQPPLGGGASELVSGAQEAVTLGLQQQVAVSQGTTLGPQQAVSGSLEGPSRIVQEDQTNSSMTKVSAPSSGKEQKEPSRPTPGAEESQGKSPVPRPGGAARTRGRRQGAKGGAKLAINFGASG